jgi:hypothetical protein
MLTRNENVKGGKANGTQATVKKVVLKSGQTASTTLIGHSIPIPSVTASQIDHIVLEHCSDRIQPREFSLTPEDFTFKGTLPLTGIAQFGGSKKEKFDMKATQIPVIINNATTGHKLQGSSVDNLFVHTWNYVMNWPYVILSRVRTLDGLFLRQKLSKDLSKYQVPQSLKNMMRKFEQHTPTYWSDEQYFQILRE